MLITYHFHLLVKIKSKSDFVIKKEDFPRFDNLEKMTAGKIVSELFRRFFMSYSKSINIQQSRTGSLFQKNFRRKLVENERYFTSMVYYIHNQLRHHGFSQLDDRNYQWSSYSRFLIDKETNLRKAEVFGWFGGKVDFIQFHAAERNVKDISELFIEED